MRERCPWKPACVALLALALMGCPDEDNPKASLPVGSGGDGGSVVTAPDMGGASSGGDMADGGAAGDMGGAVEGPTYYGAIKPIFDGACLSCHQEGGIGPFVLEEPVDADDYAVRFKALAPLIELKVVEQQTMPPWPPGWPPARRWSIRPTSPPRATRSRSRSSAHRTW